MLNFRSYGARDMGRVRCRVFTRSSATGLEALRDWQTRKSTYVGPHALAAIIEDIEHV